VFDLIIVLIVFLPLERNTPHHKSYAAPVVHGFATIGNQSFACLYRQMDKIEYDRGWIGG
jgi:hypothetical protein